VQRYSAVFTKFKQAEQDRKRAFDRYMTLRRHYIELLEDSR